MTLVISNITIIKNRLLYQQLHLISKKLNLILVTFLLMTKASKKNVVFGLGILHLLSYLV